MNPIQKSALAEVEEQIINSLVGDITHGWSNKSQQVVLADFARSLATRLDAAVAINEFALNKDYYEKYQRLVAELEITKLQNQNLSAAIAERDIAFHSLLGTLKGSNFHDKIYKSWNAYKLAIDNATAVLSQPPET